MALVKFYRGAKSKYNAETFYDGIYFALDTKEIIVNGDAFGYNAEDHREIKSVDYIAPDQLTITYTNGETDTVTLQTASAGDSEETSKAGIMPAADAYKLSKIEDGAQVNVLEEVQVDGADLEIKDKKVNIDLTGLENSIAENKVTAADESITVTQGSTDATGNTTNTTIKANLKSKGGLQVDNDGLSVKESDLTQYVGNGKGVVVDSATNGKKEISLKLNAATGNILSETTDGLYASVQLAAVDSKDLGDTVLKAYKLVAVDSSGSTTQLGDLTIDIPKDRTLKSVEKGIIPDGETNAGNDALIFTYILADGSESTFYIDIAEYFKEAEAGNGIGVGTDSTDTDTYRKFYVKVDTTNSETNPSDKQQYLQVTSSGVKVTGINSAISEAVSNAQNASADDWSEQD